MKQLVCSALSHSLPFLQSPHYNDRDALDALAHDMGNRVSVSATKDREASQRSANIDRIIEEDSKRFRRECKVLLLGKGGFH